MGVGDGANGVLLDSIIHTSQSGAATAFISEQAGSVSPGDSSSKGHNQEKNMSHLTFQCEFLTTITHCLPPHCAELELCLQKDTP